MSYQLGDKWSRDFDYEGMLEMGLKSDVSWGEDKLMQLFDSFEDVNYHTESDNLWEAVQSLKAGNKSDAEKHIREFHNDIKNMYDYERGLMAKGGKVKKRARFADKVDSIADRLEGTKVPKKYKKEYGGRYSRDEAEDSGRRIAGAKLRDEKAKAKPKKRKRFDDGGKTEEETVYIEYLNKSKKFAKDIKEFKGQNAYKDAISWGRKNIPNFNSDMIKFKK